MSSVNPGDYFGELRELFHGDCSDCDRHVRQVLPKKDVGTDMHAWIRCAGCGHINRVPRDTNPPEPGRLTGGGGGD